MAPQPSGRDVMLSVRAYPQTVRSLTDLARSQGLTRSALIRKVLQDYVSQQG